MQSLRHEIQILLKRPLVLIVLLGAASAYALLIGNLYRNETVQNIPVAVCDLEDSPLSRELIRATMDADQYDYRDTFTDELLAAEKLQSGEVAAVLIIPDDFSKKFYSQQPIELAFLQDGSNIMQASYALPSMQSVLGTFAAQYSVQSAIANATPQLSPAPVSMSLRTYGNPTQSYLEFYIYGVMLMAAQIGIFVAFALSVHDDLAEGVKSNLLVKEILYLCLSLISVLLGIFFLAKIFDLPFRGELTQILTLCTVFLFVVENLAGLAAKFFKSQASLIQCGVFYTLPAFLLSGYIWPEIGMPTPIKIISMLQPVHYILKDFRELALVGTTSNYFEHVTSFLVIGSILFLSVCLLTSRRCKM